jgi:hypothetical protein
MQFLYPWFLLAAAAIAIPIIIHLFYFRRFKKVYFTNVRFLKEVKEETSARSRLRNLLVLLMRCLALIALVLAFAMPFIPRQGAITQGDKAISIFVDNSFSMSSVSEEVPLFELARSRARAIVQAYSETDQFQIITNDFEGRHQRLVSQEDALSLLDEIRISPASRTLSSVLARQQQALEATNTENRLVYLISDFQANTMDLELHQDSTLELNLVPLQAVEERNVSIDSAWFETQVQTLNQTNRLYVRVFNHSDQAAENIRLSLHHEGQVKPVGTLNIPARSAVVDTVSMSILRAGWHDAELQITDFPVQFDDAYFFSFFVDEQIQTLLIEELRANRYLNAAMRGVPAFQVQRQNAGSIDYAAFPSYQFIVVNDLKSISSGLAFELRQFVENGGSLLLFPAPEADLNSYRSFLAGFPTNELEGFDPSPRQVGQVNTDEFIFREVFENQRTNIKLPTTQGNYRFSRSAARGEEPLLTYRDGNTFLAKYRVGQGHLYLCAAPLDEAYSDLVLNGEIFVPMLYKMALSSGRRQQIAYTIGKDEVLVAELPRQTGGDQVYKLQGTQTTFIPGQRAVGTRMFLEIQNQIREAGYYVLFQNEENPLIHYAFNYDRSESDLRTLRSEELRSILGPEVSILEATQRADFRNLVDERSQGIVLWRLFLFLALAFLLAEVLLLRFWKV